MQMPLPGDGPGGASRLGPSLATAAGRAGSEQRPKLLGFALGATCGGELPPACPSSAPIACRGPWLASRSLPHSVVERSEEHEKPSCPHDDGQVDQKNRSSLAHIGVLDRARVGCSHVGNAGAMCSKKNRPREGGCEDARPMGAERAGDARQRARSGTVPRPGPTIADATPPG